VRVLEAAAGTVIDRNEVGDGAIRIVGDKAPSSRSSPQAAQSRSVFAVLYGSGAP